MTDVTTRQASGREVSGLLIRIGLGMATVGLLAAASGFPDRGITWLWGVIVAFVTLLTVRFPASAAPTIACVLAVAYFVASSQGFTAGLVITASLLHTVHVLAGLADMIPARGRSEAAALAPAFRRWARVQLFTIPVLTILAAVF